MKPILVLQFILYASLNSFTRDYCLLLRLHNASRRLLCLQTAKLILLRLLVFQASPYAELLPCPHLFQRIVLPVVSGYLGAVLCIALTVA